MAMQERNGLKLDANRSYCGGDGGVFIRAGYKFSQISDRRNKFYR